MVSITIHSHFLFPFDQKIRWFCSDHRFCTYYMLDPCGFAPGGFTLSGFSPVMGVYLRQQLLGQWITITIDWLIDWFFIVLCPAQEYFTFIDATITGEGLQNLGLCSARRAFEQGGGIFIVPHLLWHETSVFPLSSERSPHSVASYDTQGDVENLF
jgi:hypothetical protein